MTERALKLINMVLTHEGGYSSGNEKQTKGDKGKETYCGISRVYNPNWDGWKIIDRHKPIKYNAKIKIALFCLSCNISFIVILFFLSFIIQIPHFLFLYFHL